jgi:hypothetical protein
MAQSKKGEKTGFTQRDGRVAKHIFVNDVQMI